MSGRDHRDIALEMLCESEIVMRERLRHLEGDVCAYRELAQVAITAVRDLTVERDRLRGQIRELRDEYRGLRERLAHEAAAA